MFVYLSAIPVAEKVSPYEIDNCNQVDNRNTENSRKPDNAQ